MFRLPLFLLALVFVFVPTWSGHAFSAPADNERNSNDGTISVRRDPQTLTATVTIRGENGRISWTDVLRGMSRARGYDDSALAGLLPDRDFDPRKKRWRAMVAVLDLTLSPGMKFDLPRPAPPGSEPNLIIHMDRAAMLASQRRFKARLRNAWLRILPSTRQYGLMLDPRWEQTAEDKELVVFVHGLDSGPAHCATVCEAVRKLQLPCATFAYPNDQPAADSARALSRELKRLAREHPRRSLSLVAHSLGGLVARAVIEDPELDPGNVRRLIMIAPPNHGSALARFGFGLDVWEHMVEGARRKDARMFYDVIEDGLSEAAGDMKPDSPFLRQLNSRGRNPDVRYSIFLGTDGPLSAEDLVRLRKGVTSAGQKSRWVRFFGTRVDAWLADLDEVVQGRGDGVVAVRHGRLEGVNDTVVLKFRHYGVLNRPGKRGDGDKLRQEIIKRLVEPAT